jgi:hypothetical protein
MVVSAGMAYRSSMDMIVMSAAWWEGVGLPTDRGQDKENLAKLRRAITALLVSPTDPLRTLADVRRWKGNNEKNTHINIIIQSACNIRLLVKEA